MAINYSDVWAGLTAGATTLLAAATFVMAKQTNKAANDTQQLAEDTKRLARSTRDQSRATRRIADSATLQFRPILHVENVNVDEASDRGWLVVRNLGSAPAIDCQLVARLADGTWLSAPQIVVPEPTQRGIALQIAGPEKFEIPGEALLSDDFQRVNLAVFCRDMLDRRYRFRIDDRQRVLAPEVASAGYEPETPGYHWANDSSLWPLVAPGD